MFNVELLFLQLFENKSSPPTQYLILNKNVNEHGDVNDETKKGKK